MDQQGHGLEAVRNLSLGFARTMPASSHKPTVSSLALLVLLQRLAQLQYNLSQAAVAYAEREFQDSTVLEDLEEQPGPSPPLRIDWITTLCQDNPQLLPQTIAVALTCVRVNQQMQQQRLNLLLSRIVPALDQRTSSTNNGGPPAEVITTTTTTSTQQSSPRLSRRTLLAILGLPQEQETQVPPISSQTIEFAKKRSSHSHNQGNRNSRSNSSGNSERAKRKRKRKRRHHHRHCHCYSQQEAPSSRRKVTSKSCPVPKEIVVYKKRRRTSKTTSPSQEEEEEEQQQCRNRKSYSRFWKRHRGDHNRNNDNHNSDSSTAKWGRGKRLLFGGGKFDNG